MYFCVPIVAAVLGNSKDRLENFNRCPGFGQDRVNFHWTPGRSTAGGWGLTPPGQTEPGIPYHVTSRWVPVGGAAQREGTRGLGGAQRRSCFGRAAV